jgi:hypothetical protein
MNGVCSQLLWTQNAMEAGVKQFAPEIIIFPSSWNVGVASHLLPGCAAHQGHCANVISLLKELLLPAFLGEENAGIGIGLFIMQGHKWMHDGGGFIGMVCHGQTALHGFRAQGIIGIEHEAPGRLCRCKGGVAGTGEAAIAGVLQQQGAGKAVAVLVQLAVHHGRA